MYNRFDKYLENLGKITIIETGFSSAVVHLADYGSRTSSEVHSVDLDSKALFRLHEGLEKTDLAPFVSLHLQEPGQFLRSKTWVDAVFLTARVGLQGGLEHVKLSISLGARLIVTTNYQSDSAWGIRFAKEQEWHVEHDDLGFSYLIKP